MKFNAPIVVPDMQPSSPPKSSYLPPNMAPPPPDMAPAPPPQSSYLPPDMMPSPPGSPHFLPTLPPPDEPTTNTPVIDLFAFPPHVNTSYLPSELDAIKDSINSNHQPDVETTVAQDETTYTPPSNLYNFPPNIDSSYLPPNLDAGSSDDQKSPVYVSPTSLHNFPPNIESSYLPPPSTSLGRVPSNSYLPAPSGDESSENSDDLSNSEMADVSPYVAPKDLYNFPPNIASMYLPPGMQSNESPANSYLPPPSGDLSTSPDDSESPPPYYPPKDLYNFPPNVASAYLPTQMKANINSPISSYLPPPSGDNSQNNDDSNEADDSAPYSPPQNLYNFPPNVNSNYLPPEMKTPDVPNNSYLPPASGSETDNPAPSYMYNPPSNPLPYLPPEMKQVMAPGYNYPPPSGYNYPPPSGSVSGFDDGSKQNFPGPMDSMPPPPMDMPPMDMPPMDMTPMDDHDHHHHHHHDHDYPQYPDFHGHDVIYDDHHHHHDEPEPTTTTTEAPEEPRVKKYSYYYLGRKLWYVPLYFTLWFCLYVAALIIRSIGRHKVC